jgi:hypothetical protein
MHGIDGFKSLFSLSICEKILNYDLLYQNNSIIVHVDYHLFVVFCTNYAALRSNSKNYSEPSHDNRS